ncbi:MAG: cytochrome c [Acidobacteriota bacterium]|nr:cytochrome c [Acidobacteriota bacterium]
MRALRLAMVIALVGGIVGVAAGCGGSDADQARTPTDAPTITNGQPPTETTGGEDEGGGEGDAEAGKVSFENTCQGCHPAGGTQAGAGPVLVDRGLAADAIRTQIVNGKGAMPPNLVSGADLDNVVAFVAGLQGEVAAGGGTATGGGGASTDGGGGGDDAAIAAGKTFFEGTCQGCHTAGGTQAGAGPVLASRGLAEDAIRNQIVNGGAVMPAGLATGDDLENVTKFVVSLQ